MNILLSNPSNDDANELYAVIDRNRPFLLNLKWAQFATQESTEQFLQTIPESENLKLIKVDGVIAGVVTLRHAEPAVKQIGYWLDNDFRHQGIMQAAIRQMLETVDGEYHMVVAQIRKENHASAHILADVGFHEEFGFFNTETQEHWVEWVWLKK